MALLMLPSNSSKRQRKRKKHSTIFTGYKIPPFPRESTRAHFRGLTAGCREQVTKRELTIFWDLTTLTMSLWTPIHTTNHPPPRTTTMPQQRTSPQPFKLKGSLRGETHLREDRRLRRRTPSSLTTSGRTREGRDGRASLAH